MIGSLRTMLRKLLRERSTEFYLAGLLLWLLPGLVLMLLGLAYLWQAGWFWWFLGCPPYAGPTQCPARGARAAFAATAGVVGARQGSLAHLRGSDW